MRGRCMCGDTECPSCGRAQGTYTGDTNMDGLCTWEDCDQEALYCESHAIELTVQERSELAEALRNARVLLSEALAIANEETDFDENWKRRARDIVRPPYRRIVGLGGQERGE